MTRAELKTQEKIQEPEGAQDESTPIEQLIGLGDSQGYVTYDDVMEAIPEAELNIEQLEDALAALIERGIEISDTDLAAAKATKEAKKEKPITAKEQSDIDLSANGWPNGWKLAGMPDAALDKTAN